MRNRLTLLAAALALLPAGAAADERSFMLTHFERIRVDGPFDVRVTTGRPTGARAEGDRSGIDRLVLRLDGTTLVVSAGTGNWDSWRGSGESVTRVEIGVPRLRAALVNGGGRLRIDRVEGQRVDLGVNGAGVLEVASVTADQLAATLTGTGSMTLAGTAGKAVFTSYGAGSIAADALVARDLVVRASSSGEGRYAARYTATVSSMGLGAVTVAGAPKCSVSGTGPVFCGGNTERRR